MGEQTRSQHETRGGAGFSNDPFFGGFIQTLGGLYVPAKAEEIDGTHQTAMVNLLDGVNRRLGNAFQGYIYTDSTDSNLQFSVKAFKCFSADGTLHSYAGAINVAGLVAGATRYIYADLTNPTVAIVVATAWPSTAVPHVRLATIAAPASGPWIAAQHLTNFIDAHGIFPIGGGSVAPPKVAFAWNTASPLAIFSAPAGSTIVKAVIKISTVFNGAAPTLSIGDSGNNSRLMTTAQNDPKTLGSYIVEFPHEYGSLTAVNLYITPSTASQGAGFVLVEYF